jgi:hypothetical protein
VSDFGFRAEDLRQGGVGDCWVRRLSARCPAAASPLRSSPLLSAPLCSSPLRSAPLLSSPLLSSPLLWSYAHVYEPCHAHVYRVLLRAAQFMSALAVVAERHDLIAKLFAADTARNTAGLYCVRLFVDGAWTVCRAAVRTAACPLTACPFTACPLTACPLTAPDTRYDASCTWSGTVGLDRRSAARDGRAAS